MLKGFRISNKYFVWLYAFIYISNVSAHKWDIILYGNFDKYNKIK